VTGPLAARVEHEYNFIAKIEDNLVAEWRIFSDMDYIE
jgi:hypothetical protein